MSELNKDYTDRLGDELRQMTEHIRNERPRIPEPIFVQHILPFLLDDREGNADIGFWLQITGNPHRGIDVVDPSTDALLFTVPPLAARLPTRLDDGSYTGPTIANLASIAYERSRNEHPAAVDAWFVTQLRREMLSQSRDEIVEHLKAWVAIYRRYHLPLERLLGEKAALIPGQPTATPHTPVEDVGLSGEFDDL